jgi:hypothetical protein
MVSRKLLKAYIGRAPVGLGVEFKERLEVDEYGIQIDELGKVVEEPLEEPPAMNILGYS